MYIELEAIGAASAESRARRILAVSFLGLALCWENPKLVLLFIGVGSWVLCRDAGKSHQEVLWRLADESVPGKVTLWLPPRGGGVVAISISRTATLMDIKRCTGVHFWMPKWTPLLSFDKQPKVDLQSIFVCQKWTSSLFSFAKSGPPVYFRLPKVDQGDLLLVAISGPCGGCEPCDLFDLVSLSLCLQSAVHGAHPPVAG